jgi:hypothetical protein
MGNGVNFGCGGGIFGRFQGLLLKKTEDLIDELGLFCKF